MEHAQVPAAAQTMVGWAGPAEVIHRGQQMPHPPLLEVRPAGFTPIVIDLAAGLYSWDNTLRALPAAPPEVLVRVHPVSTPGLVASGRTRPVDAVLWLIGVHAFPNGIASWLAPDDKYKLRRTPDLTNLLHTPRHALAMKRLTRGPVTLEKLVDTAGIDPISARQVVNGLSLSGALERIESRAQRRLFGS